MEYHCHKEKRLHLQISSVNKKGDLFEIKTKKSYPRDGETLVNYASDEKDSDARPKLSSSVYNSWWKWSF